MAVAIAALVAVLLWVLTAVAFAVAFIWRRRFSLKSLFALTALFAVLSVPLAIFAHRTAKIPPSILLTFDGANQWVTEPLADAEYRLFLLYEPGHGPRAKLALRLFDGDEPVTVTPYYPLMLQSRPDGERLGEFHAIEGHRYRIVVDPEQAIELARYGDAQFLINVSPKDAYQRSGIPQFD